MLVTAVGLEPTKPVRAGGLQPPGIAAIRNCQILNIPKTDAFIMVSAPMVLQYLTRPYRFT